MMMFPALPWRLTPLGENEEFLTTKSQKSKK
jgi:hypothetical protein